MSHVGIAPSGRSLRQEIEYRDAFRTLEAAAAIIDVSRSGRLVDATDRFLSMWRLERADALGRPLGELFPQATTERLMLLARRAAKGEDVPLEVLKNVGAGRSRLATIGLRAVGLPHGMASITFVSGASLPEAGRNALLDDLGVISGGMIYVYDIAKKRTRHINPKLSLLLGNSPDNAVHLESVLPRIHPEDIDALMRHIERFGTLDDGDVTKLTFRLRRHPDNAWIWIENRVGVFARSKSGQVLRVVGYAFDVTEPHRTADELELAASALLNAEEKEQRRIARELHDSTAQHVVAADLMIAAHMRKHEAEDGALTSVRETLGRVLREIRTFSFLLHPPRMRDDGLAKILQTFAEGFAKRSGLDLDLSITPLPKRLDSATEMALFRVAQEAFMNVRRHANARGIRLRLASQGSDVILEVEDDGVGVGNISALDLGVGIEGMRARLTSIGGQMTIEDTGRGTLVRARARRADTALQ